ncbi:hypothetical protein [Limnoglobus roseus]|uniref:Uncharacterized protein n=1 Tax=Limnoglobus roseus TaxID=2598579 RepID=A0A5C1AJE3_9BACT|nr:hypothetical protein [Limnoglobus roseus]QEL18287.1 hypothetical protein PX52LOC_05306 [Limnoglobus roseus]
MWLPKHSNRAIAEMAGVGDHLVADARRKDEVRESRTSTSETRTGKDGKKYPVPPTKADAPTPPGSTTLPVDADKPEPVKQPTPTLFDQTTDVHADPAKTSAELSPSPVMGEVISPIVPPVADPYSLDALKFLRKEIRAELLAHLLTIDPPTLLSVAERLATDAIPSLTKADRVAVLEAAAGAGFCPIWTEAASCQVEDSSTSAIPGGRFSHLNDLLGHVSDSGIS